MWLIALVGYMNFKSGLVANSTKNHQCTSRSYPKFCGPKFFGANVHEAVIKAGEKETGMTIHYVDEGVDTGEIILQKKCQVEPSDTPEILKTKVQELEKKWYPEVIRQIAKNSKK